MPEVGQVTRCKIGWEGYMGCIATYIFSPEEWPIYVWRPTKEWASRAAIAKNRRVARKTQSPPPREWKDA